MSGVSILCSIKDENNIPILKANLDNLLIPKIDGETPPVEIVLRSPIDIEKLRMGKAWMFTFPCDEDEDEEETHKRLLQGSRYNLKYFLDEYFEDDGNRLMDDLKIMRDNQVFEVKHSDVRETILVN